MIERAPHWLRQPSGAAGLVLALSVPAMVGEEGWHRNALIDTGWWWVPFALYVPAVFVLGGALAGWERRRRVDAGTAGLICGVLAIAALVVADLIRRFWIVGEDMTFAVVALWSVAGSGAIVLGGVGGMLGYTHRTRRHRQRAGLKLVSGGGRPHPR